MKAGLEFEMVTKPNCQNGQQRLMRNSSNFHLKLFGNINRKRRYKRRIWLNRDLCQTQKDRPYQRKRADHYVVRRATDGCSGSAENAPGHYIFPG
jgi:hypothetical protein